ncbi:hypothetical protein DMN91_009858 [Ooceraea biroi]|uniref:Uncharacterized protein n=1 Tax=Ooceraea biroi TaxID=2015173 RepID=A0A026W2V2_OOCBI|nr:uncharacterized protein LOC105283659 [Ooceraea biroi]EZA50410.1 hypothetical protein X777_10603 [Ooceraea biroi]RLU17622.1 hypothetical protein DMN91_009858 [Ooceraea biroi]
MENLCPLCMKNGVRSRVRPYQINLEEGVWACEAKQCPWPFGYQRLDFFQRDAITCDWTKDPPNPPKECVSLLTELSLYTPPMTPAEGEPCKESTDTVGIECLSQLPAEDVLTRMHHKTEFTDRTKDSKDYLQLLKLFDMEGTSTEENWKVAKPEDESMDFWLETDFNFEKTDSKTLSVSNEYCDNQVAQDCERLRVNTTVTHTTKDLDTIDNARKESNPSERRSELSNERLKRGKQSESEKVRLNDAASSLDNDIERLLPSDSVGDADIIENMLAHIFQSESNSELNDLSLLLS